MTSKSTNMRIISALITLVRFHKFPSFYFRSEFLRRLYAYFLQLGKLILFSYMTTWMQNSWKEFSNQYSNIPYYIHEKGANKLQNNKCQYGLVERNWSRSYFLFKILSRFLQHGKIFAVRFGVTLLISIRNAWTFSLGNKLH